MPKNRIKPKAEHQITGKLLYQKDRDFPASAAVKNPPCNTGDMGNELAHAAE